LFGIGLNLAALLGTLALGYLVFIKANKEDRFLRSLGLVVGSIIIIFSIILVFTLFIRVCAIGPIPR